LWQRTTPDPSSQEEISLHISQRQSRANFSLIGKKEKIFSGGDSWDVFDSQSYYIIVGVVDSGE
jgi:hypothetical protein